MIMVRFPKLLAFLLFFVAACRVSEGQAVYGNIIGTVTDPSGGVVPNATVVFTDTDRGVTYQTVRRGLLRCFVVTLAAAPHLNEICSWGGTQQDGRHVHCIAFKARVNTVAGICVSS